MCQLLGMNCNTPTDIVFSFEGFRKRGGLTDYHSDGFGIAFFEDKGVRLFLDDKPSATSMVADFVQQYSISSQNVMAHIRKATQGQVALKNTHPFIRELWGRYWVFAHNGNLKGCDFPNAQYYQPVGDTDSEQAFCYILETLRQRYTTEPSRDIIFQTVAELTADIRTHGLFNFMLSNGECLIAHAGSLLHYIIRQAPFGEAKLLDDDVQIDFAEVTTTDDRVAVIATLPLTTNESWHQFAQNELIMFEDGRILMRDTPVPPYYMGIDEGLDWARRATTE